ncbi:phosphoribosylpyrophosphate synthetase [Pedobacter panaciterrae]|uniref:phosphoribosylpyrophosphate synthetase n=1 Tax=Pedobacter panaciterrae TaxID=363849 RepID=UPI002595793B|nr:phosphoribosylpyrophosphate synthetase [uncultured Pedobacter sp.]
MEWNYHYDTVTKAIEELREKGFVIDFNLRENSLTIENPRFRPEELSIVDIYRYEGDTDPADEVIVYGIASTDGSKGIYVAGYAADADQDLALIITRLTNHQGT